MHRAGATLTKAAAEARIVELKLIAQRVEQWHCGIVDCDRMDLAIDIEGEVLRHQISPRAKSIARSLKRFEYSTGQLSTARRNWYRLRRSPAIISETILERYHQHARYLRYALPRRHADDPRDRRRRESASGRSARQCGDRQGKSRELQGAGIVVVAVIVSRPHLLPLPFSSIRRMTGGNEGPYVIGAMFTTGYAQKA